jgi:hypothetical protein
VVVGAGTVSVAVDEDVASVVVSVGPEAGTVDVSVAAAVVSVLPDDVMPGTPVSPSATEANSPATSRTPIPSAIRPRRINCQRLLISPALFLIFFDTPEPLLGYARSNSPLVLVVS